MVVLCTLGLIATAVGGKSPKFSCELNINNLRQAVQDVNEWQMLGEELGVPWNKLGSIKRDPTLSYDLRKVEMLRMWWKNDLDASWAKLSEALDQMELHHLAAMIRAKCVVKSNTDADTEDGGKCITFLFPLYSAADIESTTLTLIVWL